MEGFWYVTGQAARLKSKPASFTLADKRLVLFQGPDGPVAFEDRCLHRSAPLSRGRVESGQLICPYHGWTYAPDGRVSAIPAQGPDSPCAKMVARTIACVEQDGYVWVCLGEPRTPKPPRLLWIDEPGFATFRMRTAFQAPVESCLENFLDCPHALEVHKGWFRTPARERVKTVVRTLPDGAEAEYFDEPRGRSLVWLILSPSGRRKMLHHDRFIAPATSEVRYEFGSDARYVITSVCTPTEGTETLVHTTITFRFGPWTRLILLPFRFLAARIIRQDVRILDQTAENADRFGPRRYEVIPQDLLFTRIVQWRNALERGASPPAPGIETHVDLWF